MYVIYQTIYARPQCSIEANPYSNEHTSVTIAYAPNAVSSRACDFPGAFKPLNTTWAKINYLDFYIAPSDQALSSRYHDCYPKSDSIIHGQPLKSNGFTYPILSLHNDLTTHDPAWKDCTVGDHAFDPPRALQSALALGDGRSVLPQTPKAVPALQTTTSYPAAASGTTPRTPSTYHNPQPNTGLPKLAPTPDPLFTVPAAQQQRSTDLSTSDVPVNLISSIEKASPGIQESRSFYSQDPAAADPNTADVTAAQIIAHSTVESKLFNGQTSTEDMNFHTPAAQSQTDTEILTKVAPIASDLQYSSGIPSIAGQEVQQKPDRGVTITISTLHPGTQTTLDGNQATTIIDADPGNTVLGKEGISGDPSPISPASAFQHTVSLGLTIVLNTTAYTLPTPFLSTPEQTQRASLDGTTRLLLSSIRPSILIPTISSNTTAATTSPSITSQSRAPVHASKHLSSRTSTSVKPTTSRLFSTPTKSDVGKARGLSQVAFVCVLVIGVWVI